MMPSMDPIKQQEEKFREACSYGDNETVTSLMQQGVNINAQHTINGWTGLHWACKRGHIETVRLLLSKGVDCSIVNNMNQTASQLTTDLQILELFGSVRASVPFRGSNVAEDESPFKVHNVSSLPVSRLQINDTNMQTFVNGTTELMSLPNAGHSGSFGQTTSFTPTTSSHNQNEFVVKLRLANSEDLDFIEVELNGIEMTYSQLLTLCCRELSVNPQLVDRIRKLPNTRLRNDRDVRRILPMQELEVVMKGFQRVNYLGEVQSSATNNYQSISGCKKQTILY